MNDDQAFVLLDDPSPPRVDLFCPQCGYNLSFTPEDRCPECGEPFDRPQLTAWSTHSRQVVPYGPLGDNRREPLWKAGFYWPAKLGRLLPPHPDQDALRTYSITARMLGSFAIPLLFCCVIATQARGSGELILSSFLVPVPVVTGSVLCELAIAGLLAGLVPPRAVPPGKYFRFWRNLCMCFAGYLPFHAALLLGGITVTAFCSLNPPSPSGPPGFVFILPFIGPVVAMGWWWHNLSQAIAARSDPSTARTIITLLIPIIGLIAIGLGLLLLIVEIWCLRLAWL